MNIYIWSEFVTPTESIVYKMNADSNGNLYVPTCWVSSSWDRSFTYSWKVSVDWGTETAYTWTPSYQWKITLSWYTSWTSHIITITPTTEEYWWARAYCWANTAWAANVTEILYDWSYMWYAISATNTWNYFRSCLYQYCTSLIAPADEYLPDTVTTIGNNFREYEYYQCSSLTYASEESLPGSVTSIWTYFRQYQYEVCTSLTEIKWWKDLSIGHYAWYRKDQYYASSANKTVKVLSDVWYSAASNDVLQNTYVTSVSVPSAYLNNFKNSSNYPWVWITDSKFIWY